MVEVKFRWDANTEPDLAGYRLFSKEEGQKYNYNNPMWEGIETSCAVFVLEGKTYYFVARAFDTEGFESDNSDEQMFVAQAPQGLGEVSGITITDTNSLLFTGKVYMGSSGRSISIAWSSVSNATMYQFRLKHIQQGNYLSAGSTSGTTATILVPKTGMYSFYIRAGRNIGTAEEEWTIWFNTDDPTRNSSNTPERISGWPAPAGPIVIE